MTSYKLETKDGTPIKIRLEPPTKKGIADIGWDVKGEFIRWGTVDTQEGLRKIVKALEEQHECKLQVIDNRVLSDDEDARYLRREKGDVKDG